MLDLVRDYKIVPIVDKVFRFDDLHAALQYMEAGKQFGKIVISLK
jgi:NADPH:quinone reductase-like Zn-dependent oxidoreductase